MTLVFLPFLGGSQREWDETIGILSQRYHCITADLPGFGKASTVLGYTVGEMADQVAALLVSLKLVRYFLVGHSMAGKVSAVVSRRLLKGSASVSAPLGIALVAPSPPGPEPMTGEKREEMLHSLGSSAQTLAGRYTDKDRAAAEKFVSQNLGESIPSEAFDRTVDDVLEMNPNAWVAWLEHGSKEDWRSFVGVLELPAIIVAGSADKALGHEAQRTHTLPHFSNSRLVTLECSHLVPLERPAELASLLSSFVEQNLADQDRTERNL